MLRVIDKPPVEPVDLATFKSHLRIFHNDEDDLIEQYLASARTYAENTLTWRALVERTLEYSLDRFPAIIKLPRPPLLEVISIKYLDADGVEQTLDAADYIVDTHKEPGEIHPVNSWPSNLYKLPLVTVRYKAGYEPVEGEETDYTANIPDDIKNGILLLAAHFYEMREPYIVGPNVIRVPVSAVDLLMPYRVWGCENL